MHCDFGPTRGTRIGDHDNRDDDDDDDGRLMLLLQARPDPGGETAE